MTTSRPGGSLAVGLIGGGRMGSFHAETLARRLPGARLAAIADPARVRAAAGRPAGLRPRAHRPRRAARRPRDRRGGDRHPGPDARWAGRGGGPGGQGGLLRKADGADPGRRGPGHRRRPRGRCPAAGRLQPALRRRLPGRARRIAAGAIGTPQLLRPLTRDPKLADPAPIPPWTIFLETLIHDFDALRFLNPGAEPVEVFALADALIRPDFSERGLLDTAIVTVRFDNGALATAEASFQAVYGYDVRGEVLGSGGMVTVGICAAPT